MALHISAVGIAKYRGLYLQGLNWDFEGRRTLRSRYELESYFVLTEWSQKVCSGAKTGLDQTYTKWIEK